MFPTSLVNLLGALTVARHGSITKAAEKMNISQPAVTRMIKRLEQEVGVPLFERLPRGVVPTVYGKVLFEHGRMIDAEMTRSLREIEALKGHCAGEVRVGAVPLAASDVVPMAAAAMFTDHPRLRVRIIENTSELLFADLRSGDLDLVVAPLPRDGIEAGLVVEPLFVEDLAVIVRAGHELARRRTLSLSDLITWPWVTQRRDSAFFRRLQNDLERHGVRLPEFAIESSSLLATKKLLLRTDRIGVLPVQVFDTELAAGLVIRLKGNWKFLNRTFGIYRRRRGMLSPAVQDFADYLQIGTAGCGL